MKFLTDRSDLIFSVARAVAGFLFLQHGLQKIFGAIGANPEMFPVSPFSFPFGVAGVLEVVCGVLIIIGLYTRWAAFIASGLMAAAYFMAHAPQGFWPIMNQGELAALYCFIFLYFATRDAGPLSVDAMLARRG